MNIDEISQGYDGAIPGFEATLYKLKNQLVRALKDAKIHVHGITYRVKTRQSLEGKLSRPDKIYRDLSDVTDILGIRVITYFADDIDRIAKVIEDRFDVDLSNSVDKRIQSAPDQFGYQSLHYICKIDHELISSFEVQIRTILQHAWAEIEHDLGYKFPESVPFEIRRKFSRLSGLLEIADEEFAEIRDAIKRYQKKVNQEDLEQNSDLKLDQISLVSIVRHSLVADVDAALAEQLALPLSDDLFFPHYLIKLLLSVELDSAFDITSTMGKLRGRLPQFVSSYFKFTKKAWDFDASHLNEFHRGYSLFFLSHLVAFEREDLHIKKMEVMRQFYEMSDYPGNTQEATRIASIFVDSMNQKVKHELPSK
ncbi:GTP pyrophosphokinase [Pseudobacteriovorax antillogorgiicola]|uniref:PpGpp synthetase catalytic domain-containing protein (RelA/SpoT-type nucleotidyltranferase) n=1 Tax=Pseudobacteriovorax antillogorgiicola TaxID=1513793 RepID=A0A1Y6BFQ9_9BACT|nr:hypothetical protein [Pseudobacteriovorax antillogorgiicola]TCS56189.1 ppGpp synthetase/RelA/SpoT-type nucleotidyltransferase [Pseudobacteriovorax antillogorgiicola]SMF08847.1 ppGpp synthetase catalytic domain-containing protein (RelA/SpoT-type nucleotidyltranferase) [Pseudobacteriovorax antillogorgiicola]